MEQVLHFVEPKLGVAFGLSVCVGICLIAAVILLRPWPPSALRRGGFVIVLSVMLLMAIFIEHRWTVQVDPNQQMVSRSVTAFGLGNTASWPFDDFEEVEVGSPSDGVFDIQLLGLEHGPVLLATLDSALTAELAAKELAKIGSWKAVRRGYRIQEQASVGERQDFQLPDGRTGFSLELAPLVKIVRSPDASSAIR